MMQRIAFAFVVLAGCSGRQGTRNDIPPDGRPLWDQCHAAIEAYCHDRGQGDPTRERECSGQVGTDYSALTSDDARRQFLAARRCTF